MLGILTNFFFFALKLECVLLISKFLDFFLKYRTKRFFAIQNMILRVAIRLIFRTCTLMKRFRIIRGETYRFLTTIFIRIISITQFQCLPVTCESAVLAITWACQLTLKLFLKLNQAVSTVISSLYLNSLLIFTISIISFL